MSRPTEHHSKHRRGLDWFPAGLLIAGICAIGLYLTQDAQSLQQLRTTLGFGQAAEQAKSLDATESDPPSQTLDETGIIGGTPASPAQTTDIFNGDEPPPRKFLPNSRRHRPRAGQRDQASSFEEPKLDVRFDQTVGEESSSPVSTANLVTDAELNESEFAPPVSANSSSDRPRRIRSEIRHETALVHDQAVVLAAGDDSQGSPVGRRPGRPTVKASPANANPGVKSFDLAEVQKLLDQGKDVEAYQQLADAYIQTPSQRPLFQRPLDEVAQRIYFSPQTQLQPPYEIQPGDQLRKIAAKYQLSWQYLSRLNQVDAKKIRAGKSLKVFQGPFEARVDLSDFQLTVTLSGQYVKRYPVGIGKTDSTPIGEFTVREKLENPTYYGPNGMVLEADDPQNPLGERWIDIGNSFGIHGTIEPDSIGKSESAGCVRMRNEDVAEVYDLLVIGSSVKIQR